MGGRLITAMVTPFDDTLRVDYDKAVELPGKHLPLQGKKKWISIRY